MKYFKYFISSITLVLAVYTCTMGAFYPTCFFIGFSLFIILGDKILSPDKSKEKYTSNFLLNLPMYINLPLLLILLFITVYLIGDKQSSFFNDLVINYLQIDLVRSKQMINPLDSFFLVALTGLFIGIMGTVPGHELVHRKKNKFDMFVGNWLLAISWDCAFAIEHVHGHHKNVGLPIDPATAKRGENIYGFIFRAIVNEQKDAWKIELKRLRKKHQNLIGFKNKMIIGYLRSIVLSIFSFTIGGYQGLIIYLICAFIAKSLLEVINFSEHYGLIRVPGESVSPRHSWNSNSPLSSIYLYNVTRHSSHHEKANLKYWELDVYENAPIMPHGYLTMLYLALFMPPVFHKMMARKLIDWDNRFATEKERLISVEHNKDSGIDILIAQT